MGRRRRKKIPEGLFSATIESLSHEGRGVTHVDDKVVFIDNALPDEEVEFQYVSTRAKFAEGVTDNVVKANEQRIEPGCEYFGYCGGCSLQHMSPKAQIEHKQSVLLEQFQHLGNVNPKTVMPPITGSVFGYRYKARLGVKYVLKKERVLVGFREKRSPFIADIKHCEVLHPEVGHKITDLQGLIESLSIKEKIPQIEVAVSDNGIALVMRHLEEFNDDDIAQLKTFEQKNNFKFYLQPGGYETVHRLEESDKSELFYRLEDYDLNIYFQPIDFTQINVGINQQMINRALELLEVNENDDVLDLFCGVGNFTLPLSRKAKSVVGVEGDEGLVARAKHNAEMNNIDNVGFYAADLADVDQDYDFMKKSYNKILLDPARTGAKEIISALDTKNVERIVYVSCNPATLARDAGILVNEKKFKLRQAGVMDMFPHTAHVESIAVFTR